MQSTPHVQCCLACRSEDTPNLDAIRDAVRENLAELRCIDRWLARLAALRHHASGIVLFHTHPSGDPRPSNRDIRFTGRLRLACRQVGIEFVDHLIVGCFGNWVSLRA